MHKRLSLFALLLLWPCALLQSQELNLKPEIVIPLPKTDLVRVEKLALQAEENYKAMSDEEKAIVDLAEMDEVLTHFYGVGCSWYCGGWVESVTASSSLSNKYPADNAHDFSITTAWVEGVDGNGVGEWLTYSFSSACPWITHIAILNGYTKTASAWKNNGRVKTMRLYYANKPYAILHLKDTRNLQMFNVGKLGNFQNSDAPELWTLKFEILDVYLGEKYQDTAITELYFDGVDVH